MLSCGNDFGRRCSQGRPNSITVALFKLRYAQRKNPVESDVILRSTSPLNRACMVVMDTEPERLAPLPRQRQWASAGFAWWRRAVAPTRWRGVSKCPRANVRGPSRRARHPRCGRSRQRGPARSWTISPREPIPSRRRCCACCVDRAAPPLPASCNAVRGFFAGVVRKKLGLKLESEKDNGERVYRIATGKTRASEPEPAAQPHA